VCLVLAVLGAALAVGAAPRRQMKKMSRPEIVRPALAIAGLAALVAVSLIPTVRLTSVQRGIQSSGRDTAHFEDSVASLDTTGGPPGDRSLFINGVSITKLTVNTKLLAYVPKAARPNATTMLNICFGMGTTFRSSLLQGLKTTTVELDPSVPTAMPWFYSDASQYLHSPLAKVDISDGRNYVRLSDKKYDLITIDSPPPIWSAGAVVLLTQEFYQEAAERLTPGGVLTAYIGLHQPDLEKLVLRTFRSAFPYMTVVYAPKNSGTFIMGSRAPITFTQAATQAAVSSPAALADLEGSFDSPSLTTAAQWASLIRSSVWLTNAQVDAYTGTGPVLTDDHPLTEYFLFDGYGNTSAHALAVRLGLVVTGLLALLIIGAIVDTATQRRSRRSALRPCQAAHFT
jgi:spermidine synthase